MVIKSKSAVWLIASLFVVAFLVRLYYVSELKEMPTFDSPDMDEGYHYGLVQKINSEEGLPREPFFRAPLYPYFLTFLFKLAAGSFFGVRVLQAVFGSLVVLLVFLMALRLFNKTIALWSGVIAAIYPTLLYYDASLLITPLKVFLSITLLFILYQCQEKNQIRWFVLAGVVMGAAGLARPNLLLYGPFLFLWVWLILKERLGWKLALRNYAIIGATAFLVIFPVTLRNYVVSKDIVFIAWQGGYNFYIGNNRQSNGWSAVAPGIDQSWQAGYVQSISVAEANSGHPLKKSEVSDYWYSRTWSEIRQAPQAFVALLFQKARLLINGYEIPNNQDIYLSREFVPPLKLLMFNRPIYFPFGLLLPLAAVGILASLKEWRKFLLIYLFFTAYGLSLILFFVCARYRQPFVPLLIMLAVFGISQLFKLYRKRQYKTLTLYSVLALFLFFESNHDMLHLDSKRVKAEGHHFLGNAHLRKDNLSAALVEFGKSVKADTTFARGYNNVGVVLSRRGQYREAALYFRKGMRFDPTVPEVYFNLATCYLNQKDLGNALTVLEQARSLFPINDFVHLKLAMTYYEAGRIEDALASVEIALRLNPANETALTVRQEILKTLNP